jgi:hypothetical protein
MELAMLLAKGLFLVAALTATANQALCDCADLALVLAIDASGSVDAGEYALQQAGYAMAFSDASVLAAVKAAGRVDIAVVLWGDDEMAPQVYPWQQISGAGDAADLAATLLYAPRQVTGNTGIGRGVNTALDLLEGHCAARQVINVSGDGVQSSSPSRRNHVPLTMARTRAEEMGVTINALAITADHRDLKGWYEDHLITGMGSFVMSASSFEDFGAAIIRKLGREIAPPQLAALVER